MNQNEIPHSYLAKIVDLTGKFYTPSIEIMDAIRKENTVVAGLLKDIPGLKSILGTGYPYYAINSQGVLIQVNEIHNFLHSVQNDISADERQNPNGWPCDTCHRVKKLPDLKSECKPCQSVKLKPRTILKAIPDLDITLIIQSPNLEKEKQIETILNRNGFNQTDNNISLSLDTTHNRLQNNTGKLPLDIHIWSESDFIYKLLKLKAGEQTNIETRSLHSSWVNDSMDLSFDLLFSLTPIKYFDNQIKQLIERTQNYIAVNYSTNYLVDLVRNSSDRAARLLTQPEIYNNLVNRINSWNR